MAEPFFVRQQNSDPLYFLDASASGVAGYTVAFCPAPGDAPAPSTLGLSDAWQSYAGVYLFLGQKPADQARFVGALRRYLRTPGFANVRFLWIANPNAALSQWATSQIALQNPQGSATNVISQVAEFAFHSYLVRISAGCSIALCESPYGFTIASADANSSPIAFEAESGAWTLSGAQQPVFLPLEGTATGCVQFALPLHPAVNGAPADLDKLDIGCRFFIDDPDYPDAGYLTSLRYPILIPPDLVTLYASLDPINPLIASRTAFRFLESSASSSITFATYYRTNLGQPVTLTPAVSPLAPAGPSLVFGVYASAQSPDNADSLYLTLAGPFQVDVPGATAVGDGPAQRLMCGISGLEYAALTADAGNLLHFFPGQPAYAPTFQAAGRARVAQDTAGLTNLATTAWVYLSPPDSEHAVTYYAQPESSAFYNPATPSANTVPYFNFLEVPAGTLPAIAPVPAQPAGQLDGGTQGAGSPPTAFPMVPYVGIDPASVEVYRQFELQILATVRRNAIYNLTAPALASGLPALADAPDDRYGVTPLGLRVQFDATLRYWKTLTIARTNGGAEQFQLSDITGAFQAALQTNQIFLVITNKDELLNYASINYKLTAQSFAGLRTIADTNTRPPEALLAKLQPGMLDTLYRDKAAYSAALGKLLEQSELNPYLDLLLEHGAFAQLKIGDWTFDVSPYRWDAHQTILIFKYAQASLAELVADVSIWAWPEAAQNSSQGSSLADTQHRLLSIIEDARTRSVGEPDFSYFVEQVVDNHSWNGVLFLRAPVDLRQLPDELAGLAAGLDLAKCYAHHIGVNATPLASDDQTAPLGDTSLFGLIAYNDREDQFYTGLDYQFKVLSLNIRFNNAQATHFACQAELMVNRLFGEQSNLLGGSHGNNLIFDGTLQRHGDQDTFVFVQQGSDIFGMTSAALDQVEVAKAQFVTVRRPGRTQPDAPIQTRFILAGKLRFKQLAQFDIFSFGNSYQDDGTLAAAGELLFDNLAIEMAFDPATPGAKTFAFDGSKLSLDPARSTARPSSLYNHFPLKVRGLIVGGDPSSPGDMGYIAAVTPLATTTLASPWFGLLLDLDLGAPGALAGSVGLVATVIAAWSPSDGGASRLYVGLKLPGAKSASPEIALEGVLKLGFKKIEFCVDDTGGAPAYMLKFRTIALRLLGASFPPGQIDLYLFGNSGDVGGRGALGWYAAYAKEDGSK